MKEIIFLVDEKFRTMYKKYILMSHRKIYESDSIFLSG